jgi:hypothetical protein
VVVRGSVGVGAAGVPDAWVGAGQVADFAVFGRVAVRINAALGNWNKMDSYD